MAPETVPEDLRRFILTSIPTVPFLEALLLLRAGAEQDWSLREIAQRLYLPEQRAGEALESLCQAGMAEHTGEARFRFLPATGELREMIDRLADTYAHDLIGVTSLIHSRIGKGAQAFADAFKLRKDS